MLHDIDSYPMDRCLAPLVTLSRALHPSVQAALDREVVIITRPATARFLKRIIEAPVAGRRCRHLYGGSVEDETALAMYMAVLARLPTLTAVTFVETVDMGHLVALLRVATRDCRIASLTIDSVDELGASGGGALADVAGLRLQRFALRDASAGKLPRFSFDPSALRSLELSSRRLDVAAVGVILDRAVGLRELSLVQSDPPTPNVIPSVGTRLLRPCAPHLVRLPLTGLGPSVLDGTLPLLTKVVMLDVSFDSVRPEAWLTTRLPRLRLLRIGASEVARSAFDATPIIAGAIGGQVWPALDRLLHATEYQTIGHRHRLCASLGVRPRVRGSANLSCFSAGPGASSMNTAMACSKRRPRSSSTITLSP